jgi:hypothetical protein
MGHERLGILPKSRRWRLIVQDIAGASASEEAIAKLAGKTIKNVESRYYNIQNDAGVQAAIEYLAILSYAYGSQNPRNILESVNIKLSENANILQLAKVADSRIRNHNGSLEYEQIAYSAVVDSLAKWYKQHNAQTDFFSETKASRSILNELGNGSGFCEISRLFFSSFTERYLNYFLDREASASINNISQREVFKKGIEKHVDTISKHAFETAKITQSFAAGWFNKNIKEGIPTNKKIRPFLKVAFAKMGAELLREADKDE